MKRYTIEVYMRIAELATTELLHDAVNGSCFPMSITIAITIAIAIAMTITIAIRGLVVIMRIIRIGIVIEVFFHHIGDKSN